MPSTILVTAADAGFFVLLQDLLATVAAHRPAAYSPVAVDLGVCDLGLTAEQRAWVAARVDRIVEPGWDLVLPDDVRAAKPHLRALTLRPFLPRHFPGYETYLWVDADIWLQNWQSVDLHIRAAQSAQLAAVPHIDRAYRFNRAMIRLRHRTFSAGFGKAEADALAFEHHLNAGVFAARAASPLWAAWAEVFQVAIDASDGNVVNDQTALNYAWYRRGLSVHLLPAVCNWPCHMAWPAWDPRRRLFCEPYLPHTPISMLHLTGRTKINLFDVYCLDGRRRRLSFRYPGQTRQPTATAPAAD
ncbi:MAG: hypothetical protein Kow00114_31630 [Kiloniellaceae bacterium]